MINHFSGISHFVTEWTTLVHNHNVTNPGLFQIRFQYILARCAKMYWNMIWKSPGFLPFGVILTHFGFGGKFETPAYEWLLKADQACQSRKHVKWYTKRWGQGDVDTNSIDLYPVPWNIYCCRCLTLSLVDLGFVCFAIESSTVSIRIIARFSVARKSLQLSGACNYPKCNTLSFLFKDKPTSLSESQLYGLYSWLQAWDYLGH